MQPASLGSPGAPVPGRCKVGAYEPQFKEILSFYFLARGAISIEQPRRGGTYADQSSCEPEDCGSCCFP